MTELPREQQTSVWPLGTHTIETPPDHPVLQAVDQALVPLRPLLRSVRYDASDLMPSVSMGFGAEFHAVSIRLVDDDTLMTDLPVGELDQTAGSLQRLLEENLNRRWNFRVDSVTGSSPPQVIVVIEHRLPLSEVQRLSGEVIDGWIEKGLAQGLLRALQGEGDNL